MERRAFGAADDAFLLALTDALRTVFEHGQLVVDEPLSLIRERALAAAQGYKPGYFSATA